MTHLGNLAARLLGGRIVTLPHPPTRPWRLLNLRRRQLGPQNETLLAILRSPADITRLRAAPEFKSGYRQVAVWIIDSFQHDWLPPSASLRDFDLIAITRPNDEAVFKRAAPGRVIVLGWGSDVLELGSGAAFRSIDVLRLGRQPPEWEDDAATGAALSRLGLRFAGRPPLMSDPTTNHQVIMTALRNTRFVIAHSNLASPAPYTHKTEEYITARWTDALACGAVVAGVQPRGDASMADLLWPGAVLDFDRVDFAHNISALAEACAIWTPEIAAFNYKQALSRLDWRLRLAELLRQLDIDPPSTLKLELLQLKDLAMYG